MFLTAKLTAVGSQRSQLRLEATVEINELAEATRDRLHVEGRSARLVGTVKDGQKVKMVLSRDGSGDADSWVELTVREVKEEGSPETACEPLGAAKPAPRDCEVIYSGELPPIPR